MTEGVADGPLQQAMAFLLEHPLEERRPLLRKFNEDERKELGWHWRLWARPSQVAPEGDWTTWLVMAGRGFGKTRCGAEWVRERAAADPEARIALVGSSLAEVRAVMVEGESGIMAVSPPDRRPRFEPSLRRLTWDSGAQATLYSAGEPESLRGGQHSHGWCDEIGKWDAGTGRATQAWDNLLLGLRLGERPQVVATTTPRAVPLVLRLLDDAGDAGGGCGVVVTRGRTEDNLAHLPRRFVTQVRRTFGRSALARQELDGELVRDREGALWSRALLEQVREAKGADMAYWLASRRDGQDSDWIQRFDPRFWTVDFPRPMMASVVTPAADMVRVDLAFQRTGDLAGLIWASEDKLDHPLLAYVTDRDYSRTTLSFRWRSQGVVPLDAVNGPTLTIEGKDAAGTARSWFVRLWNYATGSNVDAQVVLPFSALVAGWTIEGGEAVWPAAIDRMFISMVPPGYVPGGTAALAAPLDGWVELSAIRCDGERAMLAIGDVAVPPHGLGMATAYDDQCNQTPARLVRGLRRLGYRGGVVHYCGMSHFMRLAASAGAFLASGAGDPLCGPARAWHAAFFAECGRAGLSPIASVSFELLAQHCPEAWKQRAANGDAGLTGWSPPSALLSPANPAAMAWLQAVAAAFASLMVSAGVPVRFQIGEPWWWVMGDGRICLYDAAAQALLGSGTAPIATMRGPLTDTQLAVLDQAGNCLSRATAALGEAVRAAATPAAAEIMALVFLPTVLDPATPEARRANLPTAWAWPAFDALQLEDYDWLTAGARARREAARREIDRRLGYPPERQDYLAGFVPTAELVGLWAEIDAGIDQAMARGGRETFVWALPQVCRDGFTRLPKGEDDDMRAFDDVIYPLALGSAASVTPEFSTTVSVTASGFERRSSLWENARLRFDVGPGVRSEAEMGQLLAFFRARRGPARGFRLRDPTDFGSNGMVGTPGTADQLLGIGDGVRSRFALVKLYGEDGTSAQVRRITRPVAGTVRVSAGGAELLAGWTLEEGGMISFLVPPSSGAEVRAGFVFDVPVRFAEDRLEISGHGFAAGEVPSVPVVEIRETA